MGGVLAISSLESLENDGENVGSLADRISFRSVYFAIASLTMVFVRAGEIFGLCEVGEGGVNGAAPIDFAVEFAEVLLANGLIAALRADDGRIEKAAEYLVNRSRGFLLLG